MVSTKQGSIDQQTDNFNDATPIKNTTENMHSDLDISIQSQNNEIEDLLDTLDINSQMA